MIRKTINELEPGMVLAQDLRDEGDRLLVTRGTELTDTLIDRLRQTGAAVVYIEGNGNGQETASAASEEDIARIEQGVDDKFGPFADDPVMMHIAVRAKQYLTKKKTGEQSE